MGVPRACKDPYCVLFVVAFMFCFASDVMWSAGGFQIPGCGRRPLLILFSYGVPAFTVALFGIVFSYALERPPPPVAMFTYAFFGAILLMSNAIIHSVNVNECTDIGSITLTALHYVPALALLAIVMLFCCGFRPALRRKKELYYSYY